MKYIIGGLTGLLKEVNVSEKAVKGISDVQQQSLDNEVTCMCWSGGYGGYMDDELTVGRIDGSVTCYSWPQLQIKRRLKLPSKCVYVGMLGAHSEPFYNEYCDLHAGSRLYPIYDALWQNDRLFMCVSECGFMCLLDWDFEECEKTTSKFVHMSGPQVDQSVYEPLMSDFCIAIFKFQSPITAVAQNSLMKHRIVFGGPANAPTLFDIHGQVILWKAKSPSPTLLDLQVPFKITSIVFLEHIDSDLIAVLTRDSTVYIYDMLTQHKPVFDWNVCDVRSVGFSGMAMSFHHVKDYNTSRRKELSQSKDCNYTRDNRNLVCACTDVVLQLDAKYSATKVNTPCDECNLYIGDNVGTIYHFVLVTGDTLVNLIRRKLARFKVDVDKLTPKELLDSLVAARRNVSSASQNDAFISAAESGSRQYIAKLVGLFPDHRGAVTSVACTRRLLVTCSLDRSTRVYNIKDKRLKERIYTQQMQTRLLLYNKVATGKNDGDGDSESDADSGDGVVGNKEGRAAENKGANEETSKRKLSDLENSDDEAFDEDNDDEGWSDVDEEDEDSDKGSALNP